MEQVAIKMMERFEIRVDGKPVEQPLGNTVKGMKLLEYLVLAGGQPVPNTRLLEALWPEERNLNPESALKTLVSRLRAQLNRISDGLGGCITAGRGCYAWIGAGNVTVDVMAIVSIYTQLQKKMLSDSTREQLSQTLLQLYTGDFMLQEDVERDEWMMNRVNALHAQYLGAVTDYVRLLRERKDYASVIMVCRKALEVDGFDDHLHLELMSALSESQRDGDAMLEYHAAQQQYYRYLNRAPGKEVLEFYKKLADTGRELQVTLNAVARELDSGMNGNAYVCEYAVFKEVYQLQSHNMERLGCTVMLGLLQMIDTTDRGGTELEQEQVMHQLVSMLRESLRKGDLICRYNVNTVALLMPMNNPASGDYVMERLKQQFYLRCPASRVQLRYLVCPLGSGVDGGARPENPEHGDNRAFTLDSPAIP